MKEFAYKFLLFLAIFIISACSVNTKPEIVEDEISFPLSHDDALKYLDNRIGTYSYIWMSNTILGSDFNPIDSWTLKEVTSPDYDYWLIVVDLNPAMESGEHFLYIFLNPINGESIETKCYGDPLDSVDWITCVKHPVIPNLTQNNRHINKSPQTRSATNNHLWAVIVNGGYNANNNHQRYWNDCSAMYQILIDSGYDKNHIFVLMSDGLSTDADMKAYNGTIVDSDKDLDGDGEDDIDYSATKSNFGNVFTELSSILGEGDQLFIFFSDHGGHSNNNKTYACLWNNNILYDYEFAHYLDDIDDSVRIIAILSQCYSGGFIDDITRQNVVILASCQEDELAYAYYKNGIYPHSRFPYDVICALRNYDDDGYTPSLTKTYSEISFSDVFNYSYNDIQEQLFSQHPQYYSNPANLGCRYGILGNYLCDPNLVGTSYLSTTNGSHFYISDKPLGETIIWTSSAHITLSNINDSTVYAANSYSGAYCSGEWIKASFNYQGTPIQKTYSNIELWHTGNIEDGTMITGGFDGRDGSFSLPYNIARNSSYYWWSSACDSEFQGYYFTDFFSPSEVDPPYTVWVRMLNPLGEFTTISKQFDY